MRWILLVPIALFFVDTSAQEVEPAVRVVRFQIDYPNANIGDLQKIQKWPALLRSSFLASLRFINKHWLICGGNDRDKKTNDCGKAQVTGEIVGGSLYRVNVTYISERDPIKNAKVDATSTVFGVVQIGLKGGIFQYTNALKILGKPSNDLVFDEAFFCYRGAVLTNGDQCHVCPPGSYHSEASGVCELCPRGTFQPLPAQASCNFCPRQKTSIDVGTQHEKHCIDVCSPGFFMNVISGKCEPCALRGYQPNPGSFRCIPCPDNMVPLYLNSTSEDQCLDKCEPGKQRSSDGTQCLDCPVGSFKTEDDLVCMACPPKTTTLKSGAKHIGECNVESCLPGSYLSEEFGHCLRCGHGFYQDEIGARSCKPCPEGHTTPDFGAISAKECVSTNQCETGQHKCHWLAACFDLPDEERRPSYGCRCKPGFVGNGYNCTDVCEGLCQNGSRCLKNKHGQPRCVCQKGFGGRRCDMRI